MVPRIPSEAHDLATVTTLRLPAIRCLDCRSCFPTR
jgi:hypothetical protein